MLEEESDNIDQIKKRGKYAKGQMSKISELLLGYVNKIHYWNTQRDKNVWVFGEWFGKKCCDNCLYLANHLAKTHPELNLYWVTQKGTDVSCLSKDIKIVLMDTEECQKLLRGAGVVIMNQEYYDFSESGCDYFGGAVTVNLWHGLMWKKIGFDIRKKHDILAEIYHRIEAKFENARYWLVTSTETQKHFLTAFFADEKHSIKAGYPRNSVFFHKEEIHRIREKIINRIQLEKEDSISECPQYIITYMPTFRDNINTVFSFKDISNDSRLMTVLEKYNAVIIEKSHFVSSERKGQVFTHCKNRRIVFFDDIQATELLAASDILITDYSSCFFDYLLLDRPIIHYIYDYDYYVNKDRGVYYKKEEVVCGKTAETIEELIKNIEEYLFDPTCDHELREMQKKRFWEYDSIDSCEKIYEKIRSIQRRDYQ